MPHLKHFPHPSVPGPPCPLTPRPTVCLVPVPLPTPVLATSCPAWPPSTECPALVLMSSPPPRLSHELSRQEAATRCYLAFTGDTHTHVQANAHGHAHNIYIGPLLYCTVCHSAAPPSNVSALVVEVAGRRCVLLASSPLRENVDSAKSGLHGSCGTGQEGGGGRGRKSWSCVTRGIRKQGHSSAACPGYTWAPPHLQTLMQEF